MKENSKIKSFLYNETFIGLLAGLFIVLLLFILSQNEVVQIAKSDKNKIHKGKEELEVFFDPAFVYYSNVLQATTINHNFRLVNKSTNEMVIYEIRSGCSCTIVSNEFVGKTIKPDQEIFIPVSFYSDSRSGINDSVIEVFLGWNSNRFLAPAILRVDVIEDYVYSPKSVDFGEIYPGQSATQTVRFIAKALDNLIITQNYTKTGPFEVFVKNSDGQNKNVREVSIVFKAPESAKWEYLNDVVNISTSSRRVPIAQIPVCGRIVPEIEVIPQMLILPLDPVYGESRLTVRTRRPSRILRVAGKTAEKLIEVPSLINNNIGINEYLFSHDLIVTNKDIAGLRQLNIQLQIRRDLSKYETRNLFIEVKNLENKQTNQKRRSV